MDLYQLPVILLISKLINYECREYENIILNKYLIHMDTTTVAQSIKELQINFINRNGIHKI